MLHYQMKAIILSSILLLTHLNLVSQDQWNRMSDFPGSRNRAVSFSIDGFGYIGTGATLSGLSNDLWRYNPNFDIWERASAMPTLGRRDAFCFVIDNKAYIGHGVNTRGLYDIEFWEYDAKTINWNRKQDLPFYPRLVGYNVSFSIGSYGYLKRAHNDSFGNFLKYDPNKDEWTKLASFPGTGLVDQVGFSLNGKGYIGLGFDGVSEKPNEFWEYDPNSNIWTKKGDFPGIPRTEAVSFTIGNLAYVGMGWNRDYGTLTDFWEYSSEDDSWSKISDCPYSSLYGSTFTIGNKGYFGIGLFSNGVEIWEYTPATSSSELLNIKSDISIYPNPATEYIHLVCENKNIERIRLYSTSGNLIKELDPNQRRILIDNLPSGLYYLIIQSKNNHFYKPIVIK
ncbi:MAG: T9SS type A sorting domain-containing protein [Bacteroidota bacterium]|nr:T9SS type A sorting domain-containing protein [Bacteroidota bacterium]